MLGKIYYPLGTLVITEKESPKGYNNDGETFVVTIKQDTNNPWNDAIFAYYNENGDEINLLETGNTPTKLIKEPPVRGGISGTKRLFRSTDKLGNIQLDGIRFAIVSDNDGTVRIEDKDYSNGQVVKIFTTDKEGNFKSSNDLLIYGKYILYELRRDSKVKVGDVYASADKGTSIYASPEGRDDIRWRENKTPFDIVTQHAIVNVSNTEDGNIKDDSSVGQGMIEKSDEALKARQAQGDASFEGIKYLVINRSKHKVRYNNVFYNPNEVVTILTLKADGRAFTIANEIDYGTFEVVEIPEDTNLEADGIKPGTTYNASKLGTSIYANKNGYLYKAFSHTESLTEHKQLIKFTNSDPVATGGADITKKDADRDKNEPQGDADLSGINYAIVNKSKQLVVVEGKQYQPGEIIKIVETDKSGHFATTNHTLPYGTYDIVELREDHSFTVGDVYSASSAKVGTSIYANATHSYLFKEQTQQIKIREHGTVYAVSFVDKVSHGSADIQKLDEDLKTATVQGDASFKDIEYAIVNRSAKSVYVSGVEYPVGQVVMILKLDKDGKASTGKRALPYGTYDVIELSLNHEATVGKAYDDSQNNKSIYANEHGYLYKAQTQQLVLRLDNENKHFDFTDPIVRAKISVTKYDAETGEQKPQLACNFRDIRYAIVNRSKMPVYLDGENYAVGEIVEILTTDETGKATSNMIPYGTYDVVELRKDSTFEPHDVYSPTAKEAGKSIYSNESYLHTDDIHSVDLNDYKTYEVTAKNNKLRVQGETYNDDYSNFPVRGDLELQKYDIDGYKVPYIPFRISLLDPDGNKLESHVIVSDENGNINTQTRKNKDASTVNSLDKYMQGGKYTGPLDASAAAVNVWFGSKNFVMNSRGSLLYGNYLIEELQCENNLGQDMLKHETAVYEEFKVFKPENVVIDLNIIIESMAKDITSDSNSITLGHNVQVSDTVQFTHLKIYNTYKLVTEVINVKKDGTKVLVGRSEPVVFKPDKFDDTNTSYGTIENPIVNTFTLDTSKLEPGSYVAMVDYLYYVNDEGEEVLVKTHNEDCNIESQKLLVPEVLSDAHNKTTETRIGSLEPNAVIYDTAHFTNLGNKVFYRMVEEFFYEDGTPVKDVNGNICKAEVRMYVDYRVNEVSWSDNMVLTGKNGSFDMPKFEINSKDFAGKTMYSKLSLVDEITGQTVLVHNDELNVEKQAIRWMDLSTTAMSETNVQGIIPNDENVVLRDKVNYVNLAEDTNVKVKTVVVDVDTEEVIHTEVTDHSLTTGEGSFTVDMTINTLNYGGHKFVVYEYIYMLVNGEEVLIGKHEDINDTAQIVMIPEIHTTLNSVIDGERYKSINDTGVITLVDTVSYKNLKVGETYTFTAELMNKITGEKVLDKNGNVVTGSTTYTPTEPTGEVEVEITFEVDGSLISTLENRDAFVAFEEVHSGGLRYAFHKDLEDEDQTVVVPKIRTTALGKDSESKNVISKDGQVIVDTVELKDFYVGDTLTIEIVAHDAETGEELPFRNTKTFVYEGQKTEDIECTIDASKLGGKLVVFYEYVHISDKVKPETVIAHEENKDNFDQTVRIPTGYTTAFETDSELHLAKAAKDMHITDVVTYKNVEPNREYIVKGELIDKDTKEVVSTAEKKVKLETVDGEIRIEFVFDGSKLEGKTLVAFETLTELNGTAIFEHKDISDEEQTIYIPEIKTSAIAQDTNDRVTGAKEETTFIDTVYYKNLITDGREYTMTGYLINKDNGNPILLDGKKIESSVTFVPEKPDGEVEIVFTFDSRALEGTTVVVFEDLYNEGINIATHADIEDDTQTVYIPKIRTKAFDEDTLIDHSKMRKEITVIDTVMYTNLLLGKEYTVHGKIMNKETGEPLLVNGKEVLGSTTFTPETPNGEVDVKFTFDASELERVTLVVFEQLFFNDIEVATHMDIEDEDQTNYIPEIKTNLVDKATDDHIGRTVEEVVLVDTVTYSGLKPNARYEIVGTLMDKATGEPLLVNGEKVTSSVTLVTGDAEEGKVDVSGSIDLEFRFDASALQGKTVVAFESLRHEDIEVAVHADINDKDQTVHFPKIHTNATDKEDGDKVIDGTQTKQAIVDKVTYKNLLVGKNYKMIGSLKVKQTGEDVLDKDGNKIVSVYEFTPETPDGEIELEFEVDATKYAGKKLVAFERLEVECDDHYEHVTKHEDLEDVDQTVEVSLLLDVRIAKADKDKINYYLKGAEITVFNSDGAIAKDIDGKDCVGITDKNGQVKFVLLYDEDNTYYVQETKAPQGYKINPNKFEVKLTGEDKLGVDLIAINVLDEAIIIPPSPTTGENANFYMWSSIAALSACALAVILFSIIRKKRKKN